MPWTDHDTPAEFFGADYALASDELSLGIASNSTAAVGTTFGCSTADTLTFATAHGLIVGDRIKVNKVTTLPTGLTDGATYFVKTAPSATTVTLAPTLSLASTVAITADGTADHTADLLGTLKEVTSAEANASTGDVRKVIYGIVDELQRRYDLVPTADRPDNMQVSKGTTENPNGTFTRSYTFRFTLDSSGFEVANE